nr:unnamed protein product [Spirometra erinaceieuropaei]
MLEPSNSLPISEDTAFTGDLSKDEALEGSSGLPTTCGVCQNNLENPVILNCLHIFDRDCLINYESNDGLADYIKCPRCEKTSGGLKSLEPFNISVLEKRDDTDTNESETLIKCSTCTEGREAQYRCIHCAGTLCDRCRDIHKVMKLFSFHEVLDLTESEKKNIKELTKTMQNAKPVPCAEHAGDVYSLFCMQCHVPMCRGCYEADHKGHVKLSLTAVPKHLESLLSEGMRECREKQDAFREVTDTLHSALSDLSASRDHNKNHIEELCNTWKAAVDSVKEEFLQKNRELHDDLEMRVWSRINQIRKTVDHIDFVSEFCSCYLQKCSTLQMSRLVKVVLGCIEQLKSTSFRPDIPSKILFNEPQNSINAVIYNNFGSFDLPNTETARLLSDSPQVSDPTGRLLRLNTFPPDDLSETFKNLAVKTSHSHDPFATPHQLPLGLSDNHASQSRAVATGLVSENGDTSTIIPQRPGPISLASNVSAWGDLPMGTFDQVSAAFNSHVTQMNPVFLNQGLTVGPVSQDGLRSPSICPPGLDLDPNSLLSRSKLPVSYNASLYEYSRIRSARCSSMTLLAKWGSLGCELGRLNSPHGFCLGFDEEIVVADTYNHRIQIFSKLGDFISFFGVSGRVDGLLWYPRKVAIIRQSQRYVVCDRGNERSRMQLFSRSGHFVRRIQIKYIDIVAGLAINQHGHIVAIDSVSPSAFVLSEEGELIRWFDCSNYMKEPSDVAIHGREYYICDFKAHCVIVFQEDGTYIRRIGGETITDFPNGIDVSDHGDVLVGDSHGNRFHIAVFNRTGDLLSEFVCNQTKVSRSCCLKITTEGYVVTLARSSNNVLVLDTLYIS